MNAPTSDKSELGRRHARAYRRSLRRLRGEYLQGWKDLAPSRAARVARPVAAGKKRCSRCQKVKRLDAFNRQRRQIDGLQRWCKSCVEANLGRYRKLSLLHRERFREILAEELKLENWASTPRPLKPILRCWLCRQEFERSLVIGSKCADCQKIYNRADNKAVVELARRHPEWRDWFLTAAPASEAEQPSKACTHCGQVKSLTGYRCCPTSRDGKASWCATCVDGQKKAQRKLRALHRDEYRALLDEELACQGFTNIPKSR